MLRTAGRPKSEELNRSILEATIEILAEVGYDALSFAEVARRAGTTPPAIYRRFSGKTDLVVAALRHELSNIEFGVPDLGSLRDELAAWVEMIGRAFTPARTRIIAALYLASLDDPAPVSDLSAQILLAGRASWRSILRRARERGESAVADDAHELTEFVSPALVLHSAVMFPGQKNALVPERIVDSILLPALGRPADMPLLPSGTNVQ